LTAAVTAAVALRELDFAHSNDPSRLAATAPYAAATLLASGGLPQGGPPPPIEGLPQGGARTLTQAGPDSVGLACGDSSVPPEMGGTAQDEETAYRPRGPYRSPQMDRAFDRSCHRHGCTRCARICPRQR
jgi:hypothetical protein